MVSRPRRLLPDTLSQTRPRGLAEAVNDHETSTPSTADAALTPERSPAPKKNHQGQASVASSPAQRPSGTALEEIIDCAKPSPQFLSNNYVLALQSSIINNNLPSSSHPIYHQSLLPLSIDCAYAMPTCSARHRGSHTSTRCKLQSHVAHPNHAPSRPNKPRPDFERGLKTTSSPF